MRYVVQMVFRNDHNISYQMVIINLGFIGDLVISALRCFFSPLCRFEPFRFTCACAIKSFALYGNMRCNIVITNNKWTQWNVIRKYHTKSSCVCLYVNVSQRFFLRCLVSWLFLFPFPFFPIQLSISCVQSHVCRLLVLCFFIILIYRSLSFSLLLSFSWVFLWPVISCIMDLSECHWKYSNGIRGGDQCSSNAFNNNRDGNISISCGTHTHTHITLSILLPKHNRSIAVVAGFGILRSRNQLGNSLDNTKYYIMHIVYINTLRY